MSQTGAGQRRPVAAKGTVMLRIKYGVIKAITVDGIVGLCYSYLLYKCSDIPHSLEAWGFASSNMRATDEGILGVTERILAHLNKLMEGHLGQHKHRL